MIKCRPQKSGYFFFIHPTTAASINNYFYIVLLSFRLGDSDPAAASIFFCSFLLLQIIFVDIATVARCPFAQSSLCMSRRFEKNQPSSAQNKYTKFRQNQQLTKDIALHRIASLRIRNYKYYIIWKKGDTKKSNTKKKLYYY